LIGTVDVAAVELTDIQFAAQPGNRVEIQLLFSAPVDAPRTFDTVSPARIALDFEGVGNALARGPYRSGLAQSTASSPWRRAIVPGLWST
jgi:hypothetical protein